MTELFSLTAALFYLTATVVILRQNRGPADSPRNRSFEALLAYLAVGAHGFSLVPLALSSEGINLALGTTLSLIGFVVVVLFLIVRLLQPVHILGVLVFPAATLGVTIGWLFPGALTRFIYKARPDWLISSVPALPMPFSVLRWLRHCSSAPRTGISNTSTPGGFFPRFPRSRPWKPFYSNWCISDLHS